VAERPVCLVTGAGRGIGATIATWFAEMGANVAICSRSSDELADVEARLRAGNGSDVLARQCDVGDHAQVDDLVGAVLARFGRIDVAVANAAMLGPVGPITSVDLVDWRRVFDVNVVGTAAVLRRVAPPMVGQGRGRVLTLAGGGVGGPQPAERVSAYVASKAAVVALTEAVAAELRPWGVTVNAIAPGRVPTTFMSPVVAAGAELAGAPLYETATDERVPDLTPLRTLIEYLVSDRGGWLSGRLLSARWDRPEVLERNRPAIEAGSRYRMRRIDEDLYGEVQA
jgi:3-oxoacyl-[acyl-carrier protein] reductase